MSESSDFEARVFHYRIDSKDKIVHVCDEWTSFAYENNYNIDHESLSSKSLWDFVTDPETCQIYQIMIEKVRKEGVAVSVPFRCDSPDRRRYMELEISLLENNFVDFKSRILKLEFRKPIALFDPKSNRSEEYLNVCSWCKKVETSNAQWLEVEETVKALKLFEKEKLPVLTHGICPKCSEGFDYKLSLSN